MMIGEPGETFGSTENSSSQTMSVLTELSSSQNSTSSDVIDNSGVHNKDLNANVPPTQDMEDSDDDEPIFRKKSSKKKASRHILDDSDSEQEDSGIPATKPQEIEESNDGVPGSDTEDKENEPVSAKKKKKIVSRLDSDSDSDNSGDEEKSTSAPKKKVLASSDSEDSGHKSSSDSENENSDAQRSSDSDSEPEMSEEMRKKLAKGAAKKGGKKSSGEGGSADRSSYTRKTKSDAITEIHAETQRLVRESEVRIPYHNPKPLGLSSILARAQQKQEHLGHLRGASWKTPPTTTVSPGGPSNLMSRASALLAAKSGASPSLSKPDSDTTAPESTDQKENSDVPVLNLEMSEEKDNDNSEETPKPLDTAPMNEDWDELPDLVIETQKKNEKPQESETQMESENKTEEGIQIEEGKSEERSPEITLGQGETNDLDHELKLEMITKTPVSKTRTRTMLTPKLANLEMKPRLSGGPDAFIDLDFDGRKDSTPKPGVIDLMDRLVKHSAGRKKKQAQDVEMSTVEKVTINDKEELQLKKITVHLTGEEETSPGEKPGAKLRLLQNKLAVKMKEKREEARQARFQMFALDNEEGFEDEEEAELTDGEESDQEDEPDEEEEEEEEEVEEDMDEGEYTVNEKASKVANPFVDDEAEDDDDDDDEDGLHLALDDDEDDTQCAQPTQAVPKVPAKVFIKSALKKSDTLQLFDDDAISESPTLSQSNKENIEVSDRPFEQLSGETIKASNDDKDDLHKDVLLMDVDEAMSAKIDKRNMSNISLLKEVSISSADNSFDQMSLIPAGQGTGGKKHRFQERQNTPDLYTPSSKSSMGTVKSLAMPIEDTQDMLDSPLHLSQSTPRNFGSLDDSTTESHLLDEDGLLKTSSSGKKATRRQLMLEGTSDNDDNEMLGLMSGHFSAAKNKNSDDEILGLMSGQFTTQSVDQSSSSSSKPNFSSVSGLSQLMAHTQHNANSQDDILGLCSGQFSGAAKSSVLEVSPESQSGPTGSLGFKTSGIGGGSMAATQGAGGMDELIGLCSGRFTEKKQEESPVKTKKKVKQRKRIVIHESDDEAVDADDDFEIGSSGKPDLDDDQENLDSDEDLGEADQAESDEEDHMVRQITKKKIKMANFLENEAELSGSEADSDENYDGEDDDVMEACSGDEDEVPSDEELRDQVERVHMKTVRDADAQELRLMKEMYLPDGDLHSDGAGRIRRFRWKNVDDDTQQDMFGNSDEEKEEEDNLEAQKWRLERHQREKFLSEQEEKASEEEPSEVSQVIKLGKVVFKPKKPQLGRQTTLPIEEDAPPAEKSPKESKPKALFKVPKLSCGSFLSRGKDTLAKIAEMTKPISTNINGPRNSRSFLFSSLSKDDDEDDDKKKSGSKSPAVRRSLSHPPSDQPASKKPRLEKSSTFPGQKKSIFDHL